jgi:hypothetical protein
MSHVFTSLLSEMGDASGGNRRKQRPTQDRRQRIELPGNDRLESEFASDIGRTLAAVDIYRRDTLVVTLDKLARRILPMTGRKFRTWVEHHIVCFKPRTDPDTGLIHQIEHTMTKEHADTLLESEHFLLHLRPILHVRTIALPAYRRDGTLQLRQPGYDPDTSTYTFPPVP